MLGSPLRHTIEEQIALLAIVLRFFRVLVMGLRDWLLREVRPEPDDWLLAVPRLAELVREVVVRDDFSADLLCPDCVWPEVLLLDSFMTFKELSET